MLGRGTLVVALAVALAGCLGAGDRDAGVEERAAVAVDFSHLSAEGAEVVDAESTRSFLWDGVLEPGAGVSNAQTGQSAHEPVVHEFEVDGSVGFVNASAAHDATGVIQLTLRDDEDRVACAARIPAEGQWCTAVVPTNQSKVTYTATVSVPTGGLTPQYRTAPAPFQLNVTLHPRSHIPVVDLSASLDPRFVFRNQRTGFEGGEPTLGLDKDGAIFVVNGVATLRSTDDGESWQDVRPPLTTTSLDPMLYVDPWTGRVFTDHLYVGCSYLSWSDDKGETWVTNPAACGTPANDHQKLAVGATNLPVAPFDGIVYYSYASFGEGVWVSRSLDGGVTWTSTLAMAEQQGYPYRTGGPIVADREGNAYLGAYQPGGGFAVGYSNDYGATFRAVQAGEGSGGSEGIDPGVAVDGAGNVYGAYWGPNGVHVVASTDRGASWAEPVVVSPPELKSFEMVDAVAGDEGRVAVTYIATAESDRGPNRADGWAKWHLYVSMTENALAANATWVTARVTPADDPVQIGSVCTSGVGCFGGNRNLLDFIDIQVGPDGRVYVAYTDGCIPDHETTPCKELPQESRENFGYVAVQEEGPRLFVNGAPWA